MHGYYAVYVACFKTICRFPSSILKAPVAQYRIPKVRVRHEHIYRSEKMFLHKLLIRLFEI